MFWIDIEDGAGNRLGPGPITSATNWQAVKRLDRAGAFVFAMPASDEKAALVAPGRVAAIYDDLGVEGAAAVYVGGGIIDSITTEVGPDGSATLNVAGDDMLRELAWRSVGALGLSAGGAAITHAAGVLAVAAFAPAGWTFTADAAPPNNAIYGQFAGETVLAAALAVAEKSRDHVWLDGRRTLRFASAWADSGVRAVQVGPGSAAGAAPELAAIAALAVEKSSYELFSRIYPRGAGQAQAALTLRATTRAAPVGYVLDAANNYLEATAVAAAYGRRERFVDFKEISPLSNTTADVRAAADMLFDAALYWLMRHGAPVTSYRLTLAGCAALLRPMQTVRVVYRDTAAGLNLDASLYILEATWGGDAAGLRTVDLVVADSDQWPDSDSRALAESIRRGTVYEAHPQLNANSYVLPYTKHLDLEEEAGFRFRLDEEITQLARVTFDFQVLPLESTVKSVAGESSTSGSGGGTTATSSSGGGTTATSSSGGAAVVTSSSGGGAAVTSGSGGAAVVTSTSGGAAVVTSESGDKSHLHTVTLLDGQPGQLVFYSGGALYSPTGGTKTVNSNFANVPHDHDVNVPNHEHGVAIPNHEHGVTIPNHEHGVAIPNHTHDVTIGNHTHSVTIGNHTHDVTIPNHTHDVTPVVNTEYGIYRDDLAETFGVNDLEYSLDGLTWFRFLVGVNGYTTLGDGWTRVDLTALLQDAVTLRPVNTNNLLRVRARTQEVYVADFNNNRVQVFTAGGVFLRKWGTAGAGDGQFNLPAWLAVGGGLVHVSDYGNNRVQVFTTAGAFVRKWGSLGSGDGQFSGPQGIAVDAAGYVYVADGANSRVQVFTSAGVFVRKWGAAGAGDGQFNGLIGLAVDAAGNVYTTETGNSRVQVFTSAGVFVRKWGAAGAGDGQFSGPRGVAVDAAGNVVVADGGNSRLQFFTTTGTFVGSAAVGAGAYGVAIGGRRIFTSDTDASPYGLRAQTMDGALAGGWGAAGGGDGQFNGASGLAVAPALGGQRARIEAQLNVRSIIQALALQ